MTLSNPKRVVSVGLGSSQRDSHIETELLGQPIIIERRGNDGSLNKAAQMIRELDGKVDAFGLGGTDLFVQAAGKRYYLRESLALARNAQKTPLVCGAGLKDTLERIVVRELDERLQWRGKKVLMLGSMDRFGMAETLAESGATVMYGDLIFSLGLPVPVYNLGAVAKIARVAMPVISKVPISWLYPTGSKQEGSTSGWREKYFIWADIIAGDFLFVKRFAPQNLSGKIILTNTTTSDDVEMLRERGLKTLITTTPRYEGRSLSTNMLEAAFVAVSGKFPLTDADYRALIKESGIKPDILELN